MQAYREAPAAPPISVVTYFPNGAIGRWVLALMFVAAFAGTSYSGLALLSSVHVRCNRARAVCSIDTSWPIGSTSEELPLSSITSAHLDTSESKKGKSYRVTLETTSGDRPLTIMYTHASSRSAATTELNQFLRSKTDVSVDATCDESTPVGWIVLAVSLIWLLMAWVITHYARIEVSWGQRTLTVLRMRWPLQPIRLEFPLGAISDAMVTSSRSRRHSRTFGVVLLVDDRHVPLLGQSSSGRGTKDRAVAEIQALLQLRDAGGPRV